MSDTTTQGVRVGATAFYQPEESDPAVNRYVFGYRIVIVNEGDAAVQLLSRHWVIIDGDGERRDVEGDGVVGQQLTLKPGEGFKYTSYCPLSTPWGTMEGVYRMRREGGEAFEARIGRFYLRVPAPSAARRQEARQ